MTPDMTPLRAPVISAVLAACLSLASPVDGGVAAGSASEPAPEIPAGATATLYLVRHGETEGQGPGRGLSAVGRARAEALAERLAGAGIEAIYTTDFRRTRETAAPLAARLGLEPRVYDPEDLAGLAAELRRLGGIAVVVGHSNTTTELVGLLGGEPGRPIAEDEHDRLYRLELPSGATDVSRIRAGTSGSPRRPPLDVHQPAAWTRPVHFCVTLAALTPPNPYGGDSCAD